MPNRTRSSLIFAIVVALLLGWASSADAARAAAPVRTGAIIGGFIDGMGRGGRCWSAPDCIAWQTTGCKSGLLTKLNPAWVTSIVNVRSLVGTADVRHLIVEAASGRDIGGLRVEFWGADCRQMRADWISASCGDWYCYNGYFDTQTPAAFRLPAGVKWMTVVSKYSVNVTWELF